MSRSAQGLTDAIVAIDGLTAGVLGRPAGRGRAARSSTRNSKRPGAWRDFLGLARLMCIDALDRDESCGAHFRVEHQTPDGEAQRDDERWCFVSAWEHGGDGPPIRHDEALKFTAVPLATRNYA